MPTDGISWYESGASGKATKDLRDCRDVITSKDCELRVKKVGVYDKYLTK